MTAEWIDASFAVFSRIRADLEAACEAGLNESDVRLRVIDRMLIEVLGWDRENIRTEQSSLEGYLDYLLLGQGNRGQMVIEAKRAGLLQPDTANKNRAVLSLKGPVLKPLETAVKQAISYSSTCGVPFSAVSDGSSWLFFRSSRIDGVSPLDGKAILFPDLQSLSDNFPEFYELGSYRGLIERTNQVRLNRVEGQSPQLEEQQFIVSPSDRAKMLARSDEAKDAALLFKQFFSKLSDSGDREMLRECFADTPQSDTADYDMQKIVEKLVNTMVAIETSEGKAIEEEIERAIASEESQSILIVGNKGSGKSTFIDRFFQIILEPTLKEQCIVTAVDLQGHLGHRADLINWANRTLIDALEKEIYAHEPPTYDEMLGVFFGDYKAWSAGPYLHLYDSDKNQFKIKFGEHMDRIRREEPERYIRMLLKRSFASQKKLPCLIFDNADQFDPGTQDAVFQMAHALGREAPSLTIVPITDRTIWRLSKAGALQSYPAKQFYLPSPDVKRVLSKRVAFVRKKLEQEPQAALRYFSARGYKVRLEDLGAFAGAIEEIFINNDFVSDLIGRLSNYDIRRMLELAERVFLSPEIKIDDILKSAFGGAAITSDTYRAHRAILKGENDRYSESENSFVCNLFWTDKSKPSTPLLALYILWLLDQRKSNVEADIEAKTWAVSELAAFLAVCSVEQDSLLRIINRLYDRRLIEEVDPTVEIITESSQISIKESGAAHIDLALRSETYIEQMALATGINSQALHSELRSLLQKPRREDFNNIRDLFVGYIVDLDRARFAVPSAGEYRTIGEARSRFGAWQRETKSKSAPRPKHGPAKRTKGKSRRPRRPAR